MQSPYGDCTETGNSGWPFQSSRRPRFGARPRGGGARSSGSQGAGSTVHLDEQGALGVPTSGTTRSRPGARGRRPHRGLPVARPRPPARRRRSPGHRPARDAAVAGTAARTGVPRSHRRGTARRTKSTRRPSCRRRRGAERACRVQHRAGQRPADEHVDVTVSPIANPAIALKVPRMSAAVAKTTKTRNDVSSASSTSPSPVDSLGSSAGAP